VSFSKILGQDEALKTLTQALVRGRVHHAYRFEGPDGVGKEMAAFALAQALVCTSGDPLGCGVCNACTRAVTFSEERPQVPRHPDVILIERGLYPPATIGRTGEELQQISVQQIRKIVLPHAAYAAHEGKGRIFIVRRAEEMSIEAANALLKTLEEPRQGTFFVLLTSRPDRLLDTIRSRTLKLRFGPLSDPILHQILSAKGMPIDKQDLAIELAAGSARAALDLADPERSAQRDEFVASMLAAVSAPDLGPAVTLAEALDTKDKDRLKEDLRALGGVIARSARKKVTSEPRAAVIEAKRYESVLRAIGYLERNASPSLSIISLVSELRDAVP